MSALSFLTPASSSDQVAAKTAMERAARAAGARFERRDGWNVAVGYADPAAERSRVSQTVAFADCSWMRKLELHGAAVGSLGHAGVAAGVAELRSDGAWWCRVTPSRALVLGGDAGADMPALPDGVSSVDVTCGLAALALLGPGCRELLARFCAIDVRPALAPVGAFRPGSVARTPGYVLVEGDDRLLVMVGWALGEYLWQVVSDAAEHLAGGPVGADVLAQEREHA